MPFSRILPNSFFRRIISKCDLRMISIGHMPSPRLFPIILIFSSTFHLFILPEYLKFFKVVLVVILSIEDRRRISPKSWSFSVKIHGSSFMPSSLLFRLWGILFIPIQSISWILLFVILRRPSFQNISSFSVFNFVLQLFLIDASSFVSLFLSVVHSRLLFRCYRINSFVLFIILSVSRSRLFSSLAISLSNPFQEE